VQPNEPVVTLDERGRDVVQTWVPRGQLTLDDGEVVQVEELLGRVAEA